MEKVCRIQGLDINSIYCSRVSGGGGGGTGLETRLEVNEDQAIEPVAGFIQREVGRF